MSIYTNVLDDGIDRILKLGFLCRIKSIHSHYLSTSIHSSPSHLTTTADSHFNTSTLFSLFSDSFNRSCFIHIPSQKYLTFLSTPSSVQSSSDPDSLPHFTSTPSLISIQSVGNSKHVRIAFTDISKNTPQNKYLSVNKSGVFSLSETVSTNAHFQLEILVESIANCIPIEWKHRFESSSHHHYPFSHPKVAFVYGLVQLNVRIRFKLAHGLYLGKNSDSDSTYVGVKDESNAALFHVYSRTDGLWCIQDVTTEHASLELTSSGDGMKYGSVEIHGKCGESCVGVKVENEWWNVVPSVSMFVEKNGDGTREYLSVNKNGMFGFRKHCRDWEKMEVEVISQEVKSAENEMVENVKHKALLEDAEKSYRLMKLESVKAAVARARESKNGAVKSESGSSFSFGRALSGAADVEKVEKVEENGKSVKKSEVKPTNVGSNDSQSNIPRNKKKKRNRNKKNGSNTATKAETNASNTQQEPQHTPQTPSNNDSETNQTEETSAEQPMSSAASSSKSVSDSSETNHRLCTACARPLVGVYTEALNGYYHKECFVCFACHKPMEYQSRTTFRSHNGHPYCDSCYAYHIAPKCAKCMLVIMDSVVNALGKSWHHQCLICIKCKCPLTSTFYRYEHKPKELFCSHCWIGESRTMSTPQPPMPSSSSLLLQQPSPAAAAPTSRNSANGSNQPSIPGRARLF